MKRWTRTRWRAGAACVLAGAVLVGCGEGDIQPAGGGGGDAGDGGDGGETQECGELDIAINPWVGYEASAHVVGNVARTRLGCDVEYQDLAEEVAWQGLASGEVDVIIENWGHEDLKQRYIEQQGTVQEAGSTGNEGIIGWYVPPWMVQEYPDITDWENLNDYADLFQTSESGDAGQLLDGDPGFVTNDEALVENLDLDYEVVYAGSEAALIQAFRQAEQNREPMLGYFYEPQWFLSEVPLEKVALPPYEVGCDADAAEVDCDYPKYDLDKIVATDFAESDSPAFDLVKAFNWSNEEQNEVARMIAVDGMDPDAAAAQWIEDNQDTVDAWLE